MSQGDNPLFKQQEKQKMLDELESLSRMLDEDEDEADRRPVPEDIPVLKSFVDDVPVLSERFDEEPVSVTPPPRSGSTLDSGFLDTGFLDKDPLEISATVRQHRQPAAASANPAPQTGMTTPPPAPSAPTAAVPVTPPARPATPVRPPSPTTPPATPSATGRFQTGTKGENPFLPKSTLDKIRENHAHDASSELRKLIEHNPLQKLAFDMAPNSKEFQQLRQKASQMVNEVIRANMPRLEAELRLKLEQEVDRMFKELKKK